MASEVCNSGIDRLVGCALDWVQQEASYVLSYESLIATLKLEREKLIGPLSDLKHLVNDEKHKGKEIMKTPEKLLKDMETKEEEADKLINLYNSGVQTCCWNLFGYCNCKYRRSMAKKAVRLAKDIHELIEESKEYNRKLSRQPDPLALGPSLALGYKPLPSREQYLTALRDALLEDKKIVIGVYGPEGSGKTMLVEKLAQVMESEKRFEHIVMTSAKGYLGSTNKILWHIQKQIAERIGFDLHSETVRERKLTVLDNLDRLGKAALIITDDIDEHFDFGGIGIRWPVCKDDCKIVVVSRSFEGLRIRKQLDLELEVIPFSNEELRELNLDQNKLNVATKPDKLQTLKYNMERLERRASDINDEVRKEVLQNRKRKMGEVELWLERVERIRQEVQNVSGEVEDSALEGMTKQVYELLEQGNFPRGLVLDDFKPEGDELPTEKLEGCTPLEVQKNVLSAFRRGESRVGIFGMGGVGKTSVAMHLNNEILARRYDFKHVYYVTVSRDSSVHKLQGDISRELQLHLQVEDHETKRAAELCKSLKNREKSLLILDDMWEDIPMEKVGVAVEGDGCKLLITTRKRDVCRKMKCSTIVEMKPLLEKEAWDLFVSQLGNYEQLSDEAKRIAKSICEECSGLPLAIITMARCMRGEFDEHVWREMLRQLRNPCSNQDDMDSKVYSILKLSYERLNNNKLRECLLYCALYPEDDKIPRDILIDLFIAVGLIDESTRKENIDKGHFMLNALESASLLECVTNYVGERCVKMHDLIRDMAIKIIGCKGIVKARKGLMKIPRKDEWTKDLVLVSLIDNEMGNIGDEFCPECPNLSVLILRSNPLENISEFFFVHMAGLRCLDLSETMIVKLPNSVANLCNLDALFLSGCLRLEVIPSLAGLTKLSYLNLTWCSKIKELPKGVDELINLKHLDLRGTGMKSIPDGLPCKLCKLETFLSNGKIIILPQNLMRLRQLWSFVGLIDDFDAFNQFVSSDSFNQLKRYLFYVGRQMFPHTAKVDRCIMFYNFQSSIGTEVCLKVPHNVQKLELIKCSFGGKCLIDALPSLCGAGEIEELYLGICKGIKYIISDAWFERGGNEVSKPLRRVQRLQLCRLNDLVGLMEGEVVHPYICFDDLRELMIDFCPSLNKIWLQNEDLSNLKSVNGAENMEELFAETGGAMEEVRCSPKLRKWNLTVLELRSIYRKGVFFPKLEKLEVTECPKLKKLGLINHNMPSLKEIKIKDCQELEEIFDGEVEAGHDAIQMPEVKSTFCPELRILQVYGCPKLKKLGLLNPNMPCLEEITIDNCQEMEEIFETENEAGDVLQLSKLRLLSLDDLPELRSICKKAIACNSLQYVSIVGSSTGEKLENCPISVPRLLLNNSPPHPDLYAYEKSRDWWNSLYWNDSDTQAVFNQLGCFHGRSDV